MGRQAVGGVDGVEVVRKPGGYLLVAEESVDLSLGKLYGGVLCVEASSTPTEPQPLQAASGVLRLSRRRVR
ncbi:hypothetical protein AB0I60_01720 [Actinosynnema sp. NPDC050436]|uniref:hypothetical protein n=1 Tax=Actinosynnema sp. NPDC050436 TaxID=3155659 RepID=UPI0033EA97FD